MNGRLKQGEKADILSRSTTAPSRPSFQRKTSLVDRRKTSHREFRHSQILVSLQAGGGFHDCFGDLVETHFNPNLLAVDEKRWRAGDSEFFVRFGCRSIELVEIGLIGDSAIETRAVDAHASGDLAQCILGIGGAGIAFGLYYSAAMLFLLRYMSSGAAGLRLHIVPLRAKIFGDMLKVGIPTALNAVLTNLTVILVTGAVGLFGTAGHWLLVLAHARAPATLLAPLIYTQILWSVLLGYGVFGDVPGAWTLAGALIIVASGLVLIAEDALARRRAKRQPIRSIDPKGDFRFSEKDDAACAAATRRSSAQKSAS